MIVQMPNGAIVTIQPRAGEGILNCIMRLVEQPLSAESRDLAHATAYLRQDGYLLEVIGPMIAHHRQILAGTKVCGLSAPPSEQELARLRPPRCNPSRRCRR